MPWSPAHPPAVPGPRETLVEARCVDPWRSASRLGVRSTRPCARDVPRPGRGTVRHAAVATVPRHSRGGVCGSTRPAPDGRSPYRPAEAATRPPPRRRRLGARPNRPRGRGGCPARPGDARRAHEVPGRRPAAARRARPGPGGRPAATAIGPSSSSAWTASRRSSRRPPSGTPGCWRCSPRTPSSPTRRGRSSGTCCGTVGIEPAPEEAAAGGDRDRRRRPERRVVPQSVISRQLANPFLAPDFSAVRPSAPPVRAGWPAGSCSARCCSSFERAGGGAPACMALPAPTSRRAPGGPGADAAPGAAGRRGRGRAPDVPARRRAGPGQDGAGAARRGGGERLPAARRRAERRQDELGARGRPAGRRTARPP